MICPGCMMLAGATESGTCNACGTPLGGVVTSLPGGVIASEGYASRRRRLGGFIVDYIVQVVATYALTFLIVLVLLAVGIHPQITQAASWILGITLAMIYYVSFEASPLQGTPGKLALGTKVVDTNGQRIGLGQALLRFIGRFPAGLLFAIGYLMILIDPRRQGLHDKIASTYVTRR